MRKETYGGARWGMAVVRGDSMLPTLSAGDRVLVDYRAPVTSGALVVARLPDLTVAVKRAAYAQALANGVPGWWLLSDNAAEGVDSRHRGPIASEQVLGVVRLRIWPHPGRT